MKNVNHEKLNVLGNLSLSILSLCVSDALGEESGARKRTCVMSQFKEHFFIFPLINLPLPSPICEYFKSLLVRRRRHHQTSSY